MKSPIFCIEHDGNGIVILPSAEYAAHFLEPDYMVGGEDTFYDAEGRLLNWKSDPTEGLRFINAEEVPSHADELRRLLVSFLERAGHHDLENSDLPSLVQLSMKYAEGVP